MSKAIPDPWYFVVLALAAFRGWKLIGDDRILDRPRDWILARLAKSKKTGRGAYWSDFLLCPWCAGFWISLVTYSAWVLGPGTFKWFEFGLTVFAISTVVGFLGVILERLVEDDD